MIERNVALLAKSIRRGQERGVIRDDQDPDGIAWLLVGLYQLFGVMQRLGNLERLDGGALLRLATAFVPPRDSGRG